MLYTAREKWTSAYGLSHLASPNRRPDREGGGGRTPLAGLFPRCELIGCWRSWLLTCTLVHVVPGDEKVQTWTFFAPFLLFFNSIYLLTGHIWYAFMCSQYISVKYAHTLYAEVFRCTSKTIIFFNTERCECVTYILGAAWDASVEPTLLITPHWTSVISSFFFFFLTDSNVVVSSLEAMAKLKWLFLLVEGPWRCDGGVVYFGSAVLPAGVGTAVRLLYLPTAGILMSLSQAPSAPACKVTSHRTQAGIFTSLTVIICGSV